jgi:hypothetical protein
MLRYAAVLLAGLLLASPAGAFETVVLPTGGPIRLDACQAYTQKLLRTNTGRLVTPGHKALLEYYVGPVWLTHLGAAFSNTASRPVRALTVTYVIRDANHAQRASYDAVWRGRFLPGKSYDYRSSGFKTVEIVHVPIRTVDCIVTHVTTGS